jgi:2-polyprenyl-3-methyl-5-hydroxy-6-metoxy-1,4-benzoquinol methylase
VRWCDACQLARSTKPPRDPFGAQYLEMLVGNKDVSEASFNRRLPAIARLTPARRVLDVGAGAGVFVRMMLARGAEAEAVEVSAEACRLMSESGVVARCGNLPDLRLGGEFDLVTFWDSLQCMEQPHENLVAARELLKPEGLLVVQVAHHSRVMLAYAAVLALMSERAAQGVLHLSSQQWHFSTEGLRRLLEHAGFDIVERERGCLKPWLRLNRGLRTAAADTLEAVYLLGALLRREEAPLIYYCRPQPPAGISRSDAG